MEIAPRVVYFGLGSNLGDRMDYLSQARAQLSTLIGTEITHGHVYESPAMGFESENTFLNTCIALRTALPINEILIIIKDIETRLGRKKKTTEGYQSRVIDIDILLAGAELLTSKELTVPHPEFRKRKFVLLPLNDIAEDVVDPVTHLTVKQLLMNCPDSSELTIFQPMR